MQTYVIASPSRNKNDREAGKYTITKSLPHIQRKLVSYQERTPTRQSGGPEATQPLNRLECPRNKKCVKIIRGFNERKTREEIIVTSQRHISHRGINRPLIVFMSVNWLCRSSLPRRRSSSQSAAWVSIALLLKPPPRRPGTREQRSSKP